MTTTQILLVNLKETDKQATAVALTQVGFAVATAVDYADAQRLMMQHRLPDMLIVALKCREAQAAFAFCKTIHNFSDLPIVLIFDRYDPRLTTAALTDFAEDVVAQPLSSRILVARMRRILARLGQLNNRTLPVDWPRRRLLVESATSTELAPRRQRRQAVALSSNECRLLYLLLRQQDGVVAQDYILRRLWPHLTADSSNVRTAVCRLRYKLKKAFGQDVIISQPGGYRVQTNP